MEHTVLKNLPIGIFDSGMGGLTVLRALQHYLPNESYLYLGDTARLPYGNKSVQTVIHYAQQMAELLISQAIKLLVVACNTATTAALHFLQQQYPNLPVIGVVEPGSKAVVAASSAKQIGVIATETTINSGAYQKLIKQLAPQATVQSISCGLFVSLAEEGCVDDKIAEAAIQKYLQPFMHKPIDSLLLGCTHFPTLITPIQTFLGDSVTIVNSGDMTAQAVKSTLEELQLLSENNQPRQIFYVTDLPERFARVGEIFLGRRINLADIELV